ncbi:MAG: ABC transporter permease [Thalassobaculales bacterium]
MRGAVPRALDWLAGPLAFLAFLLVWKFYVTAYGVSKFILPAPEAVLAAFLRLLGEPRIWSHIGITLYETVAGFAAAVLAGVSLGALMGKLRWLERAFKPFVIALQVVPKVALIPLFILWFGFGPESKVVIAAVLGFFPIFTNTLLGVKSVEAGHRDVMHALSASRLQTLICLELPSALPYVLAGMEMGIVLSVIGAVVGEYLGGNQGLGHMAVATLSNFEVDALFAVILMLSLMGLGLYMCIVLLRRLAIPWHQSAGQHADGA